MACDLPYFRVYAAESLADERFSSWTVAERGAWFSLLLHAWVNGSIPSDLPSLARLVHVSAKQMSALWAVIGDRFVEHPGAPGRLTSERLETERDEALAKSNAGRRSAAARWGRKPEPDAEPDAFALPPQSEPDASPMLAAQRSAAQRNAPQQRTSRMGVGHPAFEVIGHWRTVWSTMSPAACPEVTASQAASLAGLCSSRGLDEVKAAMGRAAADPYWGRSLDLDTFIAKFPKFLPRTEPAADPKQTKGDSGRGMASVGQDWTGRPSWEGKP